MTVEEAKQLKIREPLINRLDGKRWYVNGAVKTWKTRPDKVRVPLKHGLYAYGYLTQYNCKFFEKEYA
jgi:hypothetical protein